MMKRVMLYLGLLGVLAALIVVPPRARAQANINVNISVQLSPAFVNLPMPASFVVIPKARKHYGPAWTEYRVRYPIPVLLAFYRVNMPRHGWVVMASGPANMVWVQGKRRMEMVFWAAPAGYTVVAVRESKWAPPGQVKKWGRGGRRH